MKTIKHTRDVTLDFRGSQYWIGHSFQEYREHGNDTSYYQGDSERVFFVNF